MDFLSNLFGFSDIRSNAFMPRDMKFDMARNKVNEQAREQIFNSLTKIGTSFASAYQAYDYESKAKKARAIAYRNAQILAQAQMESNLKLAQYESDRRNEAARVLEGNIPNLMLAAEQTREQGRRAQAQRLGQIQSRYASSGVMVGTGSSKLVMQDVIKETDLSVQNQFTSSINEIKDIANAAARERLEAQFAVWSAEEQNRFIQANVNQRLS